MNIQFANDDLFEGDTASQYMFRSHKRKILIFVASVLLATSFIIDISWGPSFLPISDVLNTIINPSIASAQTHVIVWDLRLPIALMAILVGAMLGSAGAEMQTILNNPLADPFTLGISSAASFGAALAIVFQVNLIPFAGPFLVTANAFILALSTSFIIYAFTRMRGVTTETMVLVGIAMMFTFNALLALMQYAASEIQLAQIVFWMMGSLSRASWSKIAICFGLLAICIPYFNVKELGVDGASNG